MYMNQHEDRRKIILGLTGPVGSGCTEFSNIFDDDEKNPERHIDKNELIIFLKENKYVEIVENNLKIKHDEIDEEIKVLFNKLDQVDKKITDIKEEREKKKNAWIRNPDVRAEVPSYS